MEQKRVSYSRNGKTRSSERQAGNESGTARRTQGVGRTHERGKNRTWGGNYSERGVAKRSHATRNIQERLGTWTSVRRGIFGSYMETISRRGRFTRIGCIIATTSTGGKRRGVCVGSEARRLAKKKGTN